MADPTLTSARQIVSRDTLDQIFPNVPGQLLDLLLRSINIDLKSPLRVDASATPDLTVVVGPAIVDNTISSRQKSIPFINNLIPTFTSGTVTFPSADGGTVTVSPGSNITLSCPSNQYNKVLFSLDSSGDLILTQGTPNAVEASVVVPVPVSNTLPICYISIHNIAGVVQAIQQNKIFQFYGGGGSSSSIEVGRADDYPIPNAATSVTVVFSSDLASSNYVPVVSLMNLTDTSPSFQELIVTNKTISGFTVKWNAPMDSGNYLISYIVPVAQSQDGEWDLSLGDTSAVVTLPLPLTGTAYSVVAQLVNYVDGSPQFQPVTVTAKTNTTFTAKWNGTLDTDDYFLAFLVTEHV